MTHPATLYLFDFWLQQQKNSYNCQHMVLFLLLITYKPPLAKPYFAWPVFCLFIITYFCLPKSLLNCKPSFAIKMTWEKKKKKKKDPLSHAHRSAFSVCLPRCRCWHNTDEIPTESFPIHSGPRSLTDQSLWAVSWKQDVGHLQQNYGK